jgi:ribokinase
VKVILNPAPARKLPRELLEKVDTITPNETEAQLLTGMRIRTRSDAAKAAGRLHRAGVRCVVVTLGSKGAYVSMPGLEQMVPGFHVNAVDTTAAGDVFNGSLAVAMAEGRPMREAVVFANAAAAISVTRLGAQPSAPKRAEIERLARAAARTVNAAA